MKEGNTLLTNKYLKETFTERNTAVPVLVVWMSLTSLVSVCKCSQSAAHSLFFCNKHVASEVKGKSAYLLQFSEFENDDKLLEKEPSIKTLAQVQYITTLFVHNDLQDETRYAPIGILIGADTKHFHEYPY